MRVLLLGVAAVALSATAAQAQIEVRGHGGISGAPFPDQKLFERQVDAIRAEPVRPGASAMSITTIGHGRRELLVPTADVDREPRNRWAEIILPQPPAPVEEPGLYGFSLRPLDGDNLSNTDGGLDEIHNDRLTPEWPLQLLPDATFGIASQQAALDGFDAGSNGRTGVRLDLTTAHLAPAGRYPGAGFGPGA